LALQNQLLALRIYKQVNDKVKIAFTLNNLCYLYTCLFNWDKEIELANQAFAIGKELNDETIKAVALNNIGSAFEKKKDFKSAIKYKKIALKGFEQIGDSTSMASMMNNIGYYYRNMGLDQEAEKYYLPGLEISSRLNDKNSMAIFYSNLGALNIDKGNYSLALNYLQKAEELCKSQFVLSTLILVYKSKGDLFALQGKGRTAKEYYNLFAELKDSLFNSDLATQISTLQTRYETNEKEASNKLLQSENELTKTELKQSNNIKWGLSIGILMLALLFVLVYKNTTYKQKLLLESERNKEQKLRAQAVLEAEEKERQRIARDLHDGLGQRLSATKLNIAGIKPFIQNQSPEQELLLGNALNLLDESVKEVRSISHNLLSNGLIKLGLVNAVREFVNQINIPSGLKINLETIGLNERLDITTENVLYRVLQEIVNNIIKHANATQVSIQLIKHDHELSLMVEDNGVGFDAIKAQSQESGIGLKNIETRIAYIGGTVFFDSTQGKGTTVNIEVPFV
jgi:signal transduction histidine kinase